MHRLKYLHIYVGVITIILLTSPSFVWSQFPPRLILDDSLEQTIYDAIRNRSDPALKEYYKGNPSSYGTLFHQNGVYAAQTFRVIGKDNIMASLKEFDGKTRFNFKVYDEHFRVVDSTTALSSLYIQEDDHTLWLGSETWTYKQGTWGLAYAHWVYKDLNMIIGLPRQLFYYMLFGLLTLMALCFLAGRKL